MGTYETEVTPTAPGDDEVGTPAPGDPSNPNTEYEGTPSFSTGIENLSDAVLAHDVADAVQADAAGEEESDDDAEGEPEG